MFDEKKKKGQMMGKKGKTWQKYVVMRTLLSIIWLLLLKKSKMSFRGFDGKKGGKKWQIMEKSKRKNYDLYYLAFFSIIWPEKLPYEITLLQSCRKFKDHGDHQETHGKEELTKGAVLKHFVAVTTVVPQLVKAEQREEILWTPWRREIPAGTKFWLSVLCLYLCGVERSWLFHAKLQMRLLLFTVLGPVSQDVDRHSGWSVGSKRATVPSFCVQRL